ncbi:MAG: sigma-70 family RNA polymerase sigma factor [Anaerolineales bacterium]|nr:sigma-70 family RNA polymerase sigma factor [Anaerolineales bacterium]
MAEAEERVWIQRAQAGDAEAFGQLVLEHQRFVYHLALRVLRHPQEAEDVAQEAFVRAWLALPHFRGQARFGTWLYRIVTNLCYNRLPGLRRDLNALGEEQIGDLPDESAAGAEAAAGLEDQERQAFLQDAIERLPASYQLLITLRFQQGLAYDEIAGITSLPLGTVKTGLFRARARLREALRAYEEGEADDR